MATPCAAALEIGGTARSASDAAKDAKRNVAQRKKLSHAKGLIAEHPSQLDEVTLSSEHARPACPRQSTSKSWGGSFGSFASFGGSVRDLFQLQLRVKTDDVSSDEERDRRPSCNTPTSKLSGSDRAGVGKVKPRFSWLGWGGSDSDSERSSTASALTEEEPSKKRRGRKIPAAKKLGKLEKLQLARTASRRIDMQHPRVQQIVRPVGGGFLRYGAMRFNGTSGAPTVWSAIGSGAPESSLCAIRWNLWHLARPNLLISVVGLDEGTSGLNARTEGLFLAGLTKAVRTTGAWVLTPGRRGTMGQLVDRMIDGWEDERAPPICIGVLPWASVHTSMRKELAEKPAGTCYNVPATAPHVDGPVYDGGLCRNHTFLLMHKSEPDRRTTDSSDCSEASVGSVAARVPPAPARRDVRPADTPRRSQPAGGFARRGVGFDVGGVVMHTAEGTGTDGVPGGASASSSASGGAGAPACEVPEELPLAPSLELPSLRCSSRDDVTAGGFERSTSMDELARQEELQEEACARWADAIAFEHHVCKNPPSHRDSKNATLQERPSHGEPTTCAVLLCVAGDVALLERVLAHLHQGPGAPLGAAGSVLVVSDSGGASSELYHFYVKGQLGGLPGRVVRNMSGESAGSMGREYSGKSPGSSKSSSKGRRGGYDGDDNSTGIGGLRSPRRVASGEATEADDLERREELLVAIRDLALRQSKDKGNDVLTFVSARDSPSRQCEAILNASLDSCTLPFDRVQHAVGWAEPTLVKEQLQLVPHVVASLEYVQCLARALERALLLSLSKNVADNVVHLLLDRRVDVAQITLKRLFDFTTAGNERPEVDALDDALDERPVDASPAPLGGPKGGASYHAASTRSVLAGVGASPIEGIWHPQLKHRSNGRRGSTLPNKVYMRRASLGVRCSAVPLTHSNYEGASGTDFYDSRQDSSRSHDGADEEADPFDLLCRMLRGRVQSGKQGPWNQCGYAENIAARRKLHSGSGGGLFAAMAAYGFARQLRDQQKALFGRKAKPRASDLSRSTPGGEASTASATRPAQGFGIETASSSASAMHDPDVSMPPNPDQPRVTVYTPGPMESPAPAAPEGELTSMCSERGAGIHPLGTMPLGVVPLGAVPEGAVPLGAVPEGTVERDDEPPAADSSCDGMAADGAGVIASSSGDMAGSSAAGTSSSAVGPTEPNAPQGTEDSPKASGGVAAASLQMSGDGDATAKEEKGVAVGRPGVLKLSGGAGAPPPKLKGRSTCRFARSESDESSVAGAATAKAQTGRKTIGARMRRGRELLRFRRNPLQAVDLPTLAPNWTDLLLWAVLKGKHSLTRRLWELTEEPLRAAIIIIRVTKHTAANTKPSHTGGLYSEAELTEKAEEYERWAIGLLSRVPDDDGQQIMDLLTRAPIRFAQRAPVVLWPNSVLDEATERAHPCMEFVAHPHCQSVLSDYWHGNYVGSKAAIPRGKLFPVFVQILIKLITFNFPPSWLCLLPVARSQYSQPATAAAIFDGDTVADVSTEDDEFCRAYFSATARREMRRARSGEDAPEATEKSQRKPSGGRRKAMSIIARTTLAPPAKMPSKTSNPSFDALHLEDWAVEQWEEFSALHWHFWAIPKVRFVVDASFRAILLVIQFILVTGHYFYPGWMPQLLVPHTDAHGQAGFELVAYVDGGRPPYILYSWSRFTLETIAFLLALARVDENVKSVHWSPFFFYTSMKFTDLFNCSLICACYVLRVVTALAYHDEFEEYYMSVNAVGADLGMDGQVCERFFSAESCPRLTTWARMTNAIMAISAMLLAFTFLSTLAYNRALGHALTMLFAMIYDSTSVLVIIGVLAVGFGFASMPLLPSLIGTVQYEQVINLTRSAAGNVTYPGGPFVNPSSYGQILKSTVFWAEQRDNLNFLYPLWIGLYGSITLLDMGTYMELASDPMNDTSIAAFLLWIFAFFVSVFCMNLLIARMASRYEMINKSSSSYRRFQHIALIKRYKDEGPAPPINLFMFVINFGCWLLRKFPPTRRIAPERSRREAHHHFTVFSGAVATAQSARIERSYLRDYVREDEAKADASRKEADLVHQAVKQGIWSLRQGLSEDLDKLEGRLEGNTWRQTPRVRFDASGRHSSSNLASPARRMPTGKQQPPPATRNRSFAARRQHLEDIQVSSD